MNTQLKTTGGVIAVTAAALLAIAPVSASAAQTGKCIGANSCKGQSSCKTATSSCKGLNSCKGQGFLEMTRVQCDEAGGQFES
jgi:uncharacterized membrane protein